MARVLRIAIPMFYDVAVKDIIKLLPVEGGRVLLDSEEVKDSTHKLLGNDVNITISFDLAAYGTENGIKINVEAQNTDLDDFKGRARKAHYHASRISEQNVPYKDLKESYVIWLFINPDNHYEDHIIYRDDQVGKFEIREKDSKTTFKYIGFEKTSITLTKEEFLERQNDTFMHTIEVYLSDENKNEVSDFQFLREIFYNVRSVKETEEIMALYDWDLNKKENKLMEERRGIFDFRYDQGKEAGRAEDIKNLTSSLIEDSNGKLSFDEALAKAKIMLKIDS